jgi:hypothetical protein
MLATPHPSQAEGTQACHLGNLGPQPQPCDNPALYLQDVLGHCLYSGALQTFKAPHACRVAPSAWHRLTTFAHLFCFFVGRWGWLLPTEPGYS